MILAVQMSNSRSHYVPAILIGGYWPELAEVRVGVTAKDIIISLRWETRASLCLIGQILRLDPREGNELGLRSHHETSHLPVNASIPPDGNH